MKKILVYVLGIMSLVVLVACSTQKDTATSSTSTSSSTTATTTSSSVEQEVTRTIALPMKIVEHGMEHTETYQVTYQWKRYKRLIIDVTFHYTGESGIIYSEEFKNSFIEGYEETRSI